jgi:hypothetical protein
VVPSYIFLVGNLCLFGQFIYKITVQVYNWRTYIKDCKVNYSLVHISLKVSYFTVSQYQFLKYTRLHHITIHNTCAVAVGVEPH